MIVTGMIVAGVIVAGTIVAGTVSSDLDAGGLLEVRRGSDQWSPRGASTEGTEGRAGIEELEDLARGVALLEIGRAHV